MTDTPELTRQALDSFAGQKMSIARRKIVEAVARAFPGGVADRLLMLEAGYEIALGELFTLRAENAELKERVEVMVAHAEGRS